METKQTTESEQTVNSEQSKKITPDAELNTPDNKNEGGTSSGISTILKRIWAYVLQNPVGSSGWAMVIVVILAQIIIPKAFQVEVKLTGEDISILVQPGKSEESLELEKSLQKLEKNPKSSVVNRAVAEAHRLKQIGKN